MQNLLVIPANKKFSLPAAYLLLVTFFLLYVLVFAFDYTNTRTVINMIVWLPVIVLLFAYSLYGFLNYFKRNRQDAVLTINSAGFNDNTGLLSCGKINWDEIVSVEKQQKVSFQFIIIKVKNPGNIINRQPLWKQLILSRLQKKFGSPILISDKQVNYEIDELYNYFSKKKV